MVDQILLKKISTWKKIMILIIFMLAKGLVSFFIRLIIERNIINFFSHNVANLFNYLIFSIITKNSYGKGYDIQGF
jgi:hypothetical protein